MVKWSALQKLDIWLGGNKQTQTEKGDKTYDYIPLREFESTYFNADFCLSCYVHISVIIKLMYLGNVCFIFYSNN